MVVAAGVIFDMDGVLVDSYAAHLRSWQLLAEEIGSPITEDQFAATFGQTNPDIIRRTFKIESPQACRRLGDRKEAMYRELIRGRVPAMPGAVGAVKVLYDAAFRLAVGSSGPPENVALVCDEMGLTPCLSVLVTGSDVQRGKPDPQVFQLAAERMDLPASACVVVEDAPAGIEAARRAGMRVIALVGSHPAAGLTVADHVIEHLDQLRPDLVRALLPTQ